MIHENRNKEGILITWYQKVLEIRRLPQDEANAWLEKMDPYPESGSD
jgi:hypothetical protein